MSTGERRRSARAATQRGGIIEPLIERGLRRPVQIIDVSAQGMQFIADRGEAVGTRIRIEASPASDRSGSLPIEANGRVVRVSDCGKACAVGVLFEQPNLPVTRVRPTKAAAAVLSEASDEQASEPIVRLTAQLTAARSRMNPVQYVNFAGAVTVLAAILALLYLLADAPPSIPAQDTGVMFASRVESQKNVASKLDDSGSSNDLAHSSRKLGAYERTLETMAAPSTQPQNRDRTLAQGVHSTDHPEVQAADTIEQRHAMRGFTRRSTLPPDVFDSEGAAALVLASRNSITPIPEFTERPDALAGRRGDLLPSGAPRSGAAGNSMAGKVADSQRPSQGNAPAATNVYLTRAAGRSARQIGGETDWSLDRAIAADRALRGRSVADTPITAMNLKSPTPAAFKEFDDAPISIFVDLSERALSIAAYGSVIRSFRAGTGANRSTPVGTFMVINKILDPDWYNRGTSVKAGDPSNPLGRHWLGLADGSGKAIPIGIHATADIGALGQSASRGCVRLSPGDAEALFRLCPTGTPVVICP
jgi:lipoprotein-anchoring transpeptidase ErfK/SrfK